MVKHFDPCFLASVLYQWILFFQRYSGFLPETNEVVNRVQVDYLVQHRILLLDWFPGEESQGETCQELLPDIDTFVIWFIITTFKFLFSNVLFQTLNLNWHTNNKPC